MEPVAGQRIGQRGDHVLLSDQLPEQMVPSFFMVLDELPLTPSGKLDRRALPPPNASRGGFHVGYQAPSTPIEETVSRIWTEVLKLDRVGVNDDFFASGGHSLLAIQVIARVRAAFGIELPLRTLFEAPTIGGLAGRLDEALRLVSEVTSLSTSDARTQLARGRQDI